MMRWAVVIVLLLGVCVSADAGNEQTLRKGGSIVGKIEGNGDVRINGSIKGRFESNGDIRVNGSIEGRIENNGDIVLTPGTINNKGMINTDNGNIYINGEHLFTVTADGIIIATPTGSTGYSMSAGGPIVEPEARLMIITPINAHIINGKSIILSSEDRVEIEIGEGRRKQREEALVTFDGGEAIKVFSSDLVVVSKSDRLAQIMRINKRSFLKKLSKKMQEASK